MLSRLQNLVFILLFVAVIGLLGWLSEQHSIEVDLTWGNRNSLTEASVNALQALDKPVKITAFVRDGNKAVQDIIKDMVERYQRHKPDIDISFLNPDLVPQLVREHGITVDGEILVQYGLRQETLDRERSDQRHRQPPKQPVGLGLAAAMAGQESRQHGAEHDWPGNPEL